MTGTRVRSHLRGVTSLPSRNVPPALHAVTVSNDRYDSPMERPLPIACIFRSTRTDHDEADYQAWSARIELLVASAPGYRTHVSLRDPVTREGVTIAYFDDLESIAAWRDHGEHVRAQQLGRERFYDDYIVQIAPVVREYSWHRPLRNDVELPKHRRTTKGAP